MPRREIHQIVEVYSDFRTGLCSICGDTKVWLRSDNQKYRCATSVRSRLRTQKYGISIEKQQSLLKDQEYLCAICKVSFQETREYLDHCHKTGAVRGFLCINCNTGLGSFGDDIEILKNAVEYLSNVG